MSLGAFNFCLHLLYSAISQAFSAFTPPDLSSVMGELCLTEELKGDAFWLGPK